MGWESEEAEKPIRVGRASGRYDTVGTGGMRRGEVSSRTGQPIGEGWEDDR